jgi:hypothetical protein
MGVLIHHSTVRQPPNELELTKCGLPPVRWLLTCEDALLATENRTVASLSAIPARLATAAGRALDTVDLR